MEVLNAGDYVIIDTDYIEKYNEFKMSHHEYYGPRENKTYDFERRYLELQKNKQSNEDSFDISL